VGADSAGLEEYVVEAVSGERIGKVAALLRRNGEVILAVEIGTPPLRHDVRAFPWEEVKRIDHEELAVRLRLGPEALEQSLELDPGKRVEGGRAEAVRLTSLPPELTPWSSPASPGPVDRPAYGAALGLGAIGFLALLAAIVLVTLADSAWALVAFALPAAILALAAVMAYRFLRNPWERRRG
jgi:hypothetical protein